MPHDPDASPDPTAAAAAEAAAAAPDATPTGVADLRPVMLHDARRLATLTVAWDALAGLLAIVTGVIAGSIALVGFGIYCLVETLSGGLLLWRLTGELDGSLDEDVAAELTRRARTFLAVAMLALAAYIAYQAVLALVGRQAPLPSPAGLALVVISIGVTFWLARGKGRLGVALRDDALMVDARRMLAGVVLAVVTAAGLALNLVAGLWWADPVAALCIALLLAGEGIGALRAGLADA